MPWKMQERYRMVTHCVKNEDMDEYNSYQQWKCDLQEHIGTGMQYD